MKRAPRVTIARRCVGASFLVAFAVAVQGDVAWFQGSALATRSFGWLPLVDPLAALELALATGGLPLQVALGAGALLLATAVLGPVFCGWVCPLGFLLDLGDSARQRIQRFWRVVAPSARAAARGLRTGVLGAVVGATAVSGLPIFTPWSPIQMAASIGTGAVIPIAVVATLLALEWLLPRVWCRSLCPLGALHALVGGRARLRVQVATATAGKLRCRLCSRHCPMGIPVMETYALGGADSISDPACTRCGTCTDGCPGGVLRLGFRRLDPTACSQPPAASNSSVSAQSRE